MVPHVFNLGPTELLIILAILLLLFGGARLAGLGKSTGRALREFKEETKDLKGKDGQQLPPAADDSVQQSGQQSGQQPYAQPYAQQPYTQQAPAQQQPYPQQAPQQPYDQQPSPQSGYEQQPPPAQWQQPSAGSVQDPSTDARRES